MNTVLLTLKLAVITTTILFGVGIPVAFWLARSKRRFKPLVAALVALPLVLPPTVLGFYLLLMMSPGSWFGSLAETVLGKPLVFSFEGLVIGSVIYSLPFMVHPVQSGMKGLSPRLYEAAQSLGKSNLQILCNVVLPNIKPSLLAGLVLTFAHTVGEFGVVLMIGGSIPGETRVASIAIYDEVEALNYSTANTYALILVGISFLALIILYSGKRKTNRFW